MNLLIPRGEFAGYIFDLDGTLLDTMPFHYRAWVDAMQAAGVNGTLEEEFFYSLAGVPTRDVMRIFANRFGNAFNDDRVLHDKERIFLELQKDVRTIAPVVEFARRSAASSPVAVASGGPRTVVMDSLKVAGLASLFPIVVTADDVERGKPAPDAFLRAASLMGVTPNRCLVFEDADVGIAAAEAAGMRWVRVPSRGR